MCSVSAKDGADGVFGFSVENSPESSPPVDKSQGHGPHKEAPGARFNIPETLAGVRDEQMPSEVIYGARKRALAD